MVKKRRAKERERGRVKSRGQGRVSDRERSTGER